MLEGDCKYGKKKSCLNLKHLGGVHVNVINSNLNLIDGFEDVCLDIGINTSIRHVVTPCEGNKVGVHDEDFLTIRC